MLPMQASHGGDAYIPLYWDLLAARDVYYARYIDWFVTVRSCLSSTKCLQQPVTASLGGSDFSARSPEHPHLGALL